MFVKNTRHLQEELFPFKKEFRKDKREKLEKSEEMYFYNTVFCNIKEEDFKVIYDEYTGSPNAPINSMVASLILMNRHYWTYEELFNRIDFDFLTRTALGLRDLNETPFCEATIFNFQNRLSEYYIKTGDNLIEKVFDRLSQEQLKNLKIKTNIQRSDSTLIGSNIRNYTRLQLLVEIIIRVNRILTDDDKKAYEAYFATYVKQTSGQYIYRIKGKDTDEKLSEIGQLYYWINANLKEKYGNLEIFKVFERSYLEHFKTDNEKIEIRSNEEMHSGMLQSPDDLDATYRKKSGQISKGQVINITETANPENPIQLITDIVVKPNNVDDSAILNERIGIIKEKSPDLEEMHTDGGYGSEGNDKEMEAQKIIHIQTAIRGREEKVEMKLDKIDEKKFKVSCPMQCVESEKTAKKNKAEFNLEVCKNCPLTGDCPAIVMNKARVFYFKDEYYLMKKRQDNILNIPKERRGLRPSVEATVKEIKCPSKGKLKVRGIFKTMLYAFTRGISVNFGRIYRYCEMLA
jgi:hypothetical protein